MGKSKFIENMSIPLGYPPKKGTPNREDHKDLLRSLEAAQENVHAAERSLILLEKRLLDLISNQLASKTLAFEIKELLREAGNYQILFNKIWRDILIEYRIKADNLKGECK